MISRLPAHVVQFIYSDTKFAVVWLIIRLYVGWEWISAGWAKAHNSAWVGDHAGAAVQGFLTGALTKTGGMHPDVQWWYASFVENFALHHTTFFSYLVTYGEIAVGLGLILGIFTTAAAFFGSVMNLNYLLAGTVSVNPIMLVLQILLMCAWRTNSLIGLEKYTLRYLPFLRR